MIGSMCLMFLPHIRAFCYDVTKTGNKMWILLLCDVTDTDLKVGVSLVMLLMQVLKLGFYWCVMSLIQVLKLGFTDAGLKTGVLLVCDVTDTGLKIGVH